MILEPLRGLIQFWRNTAVNKKAKFINQRQSFSGLT